MSLEQEIRDSYRHAIEMTLLVAMADKVLGKEKRKALVKHATELKSEQWREAAEKFGGNSIILKTVEEFEEGVAKDE